MSHNQAAVALRCGLDIDTTPSDALMAAGCGLGLAIADSMADAGDYADNDTSHGFDLLDDWEYPE